ncbi:hypothetical protein Slin15195_G019680 [Septoria linicola]|uniref:Uncharacterized protein n=1 Tax=Septoria linicola TaxID=215465 RepID=A0A9Q9AFT1_9PEZI|nr:hypothetical protein Slin15195_G019680 [Septoria linicola]
MSSTRVTGADELYHSSGLVTLSYQPVKYPYPPTKSVSKGSETYHLSTASLNLAVYTSTKKRTICRHLLTKINTRLSNVILSKYLLLALFSAIGQAKKPKDFEPDPLLTDNKKSPDGKRYCSLLL